MDIERLKSESGRSKGEFNYVAVVLVIALIVAAYWGWKYGPGIYLKMQMGTIASQCAARMNKQQDPKVRESLKKDIESLGLVFSEVYIELDRSDNANKECYMEWDYRSKHLWGSEIVVEYYVTGTSTLGNL